MTETHQSTREVVDDFNPIKTADDIRAALATINAMSTDLMRRDQLLIPQEHGFPDLLGEDLVKKRNTESKKEHIARQESAIFDFVSKNIYLTQDGRPRYIKLVREARRLIADMFYGRCRKAILWKSRGGGGSTSAAVLIFLEMVYKAREFTNLAGSGAQARSIYEKVVEFCGCNAGIKQYLIDGDPLVSRTHFFNGAKLHCINATDKAVRSKHDSGLIIDEGCQEDAKSGEVMKTALQNAMTQPEPLILVLSTFHHPEGFFQEYWDDADKFGFGRYKWSIYDTMTPCTLDIDCHECYLTSMTKERDEKGKVIGETWSGCDGTARNSDGYQPYETVVNIKKTNEGSTIFPVEFECVRPRFYGSIYDIDALSDAMWEEITWYEDIEKSVGIDWGYVGQTAIPLIVRSELGVACIECGWFHENSIGDIIGYLKDLRDEYGRFTIYADSSDQFSNRELHEEGFKVVPIVFKKWKEFGIQNTSKFFNTGRLQLLDGAPGIDELASQLRGYRADPSTGKPIKKDDHGPDALMCGMMHWRFFEMFQGSPNLRRLHPEMFDKESGVGDDMKPKILVNNDVILI